MPKTDIRFTENQLLNLAHTAIAQIDARGRRGTEMLSYEQIEALACLVVISGLVPMAEQAREASKQQRGAA